MNIKEKLEKYRFDDPQLLVEMTDVLKKTYYKYVDEDSLNEPEFKQDIEDHLFKRYHNTLFNYVPWIMECFDLTNKNIIEVGCGTGSSTAAFARFCNHINAYEIASESLSAARERMRIMGVDNVDIREVTPENILSKIKADNPLGVDVVILFAVLEHMKINERLETLKDAWNLLKPNGILIIAETPNRLTYYDAHTSWLPFFHMLPEDLGIEYYQKSPRNNFKQAISRSIEDAGTEGGKETLIRWGNGVSFHEFEIAIESDLNDLIINDGNAKEMRAIYPVSPTEELLKSYFEQAQINQPLTFTQEILNFILQKKVSENVFGKLTRTDFISEAKLDDISTYDLGCELLQRLKTEPNNQLLSQYNVNLFSTLEKILNQRLESFENRFSLKWLARQFYGSYRYWQNHQIPIKDATYVEIGAGAINPFSFMFLYLMLGAKKCFCLEPDSLVNKPLILQNLAETVGKFIINPGKVIGDYPITKDKILENISSFKLDALLEGKEEGLDTEKLVYLPESLFNNSIPDNTADVLITVSVLEHLPDIDETLQEIARITKTGGYGLHNIDGIDHRHYHNSDIHPLEFLRVDTNEKIVDWCNRIRPLNFTEIFERNGFEVLEIRPYGKVEVSQELRNSFVEPFRSMTQEWLEVTQAYFLVRKK